LALQRARGAYEQINPIFPEGEDIFDAISTNRDAAFATFSVFPGRRSIKAAEPSIDDDICAQRRLAALFWAPWFMTNDGDVRAWQREESEKVRSGVILPIGCRWRAATPRDRPIVRAYEIARLC